LVLLNFMKKAIVIGASSGIGKELAKLLSERNYLVGITGRRATLLKTLQHSAPDRFRAKAFDATDPNAISYLHQLVDEMGGLDLLVISSGTGDLNESLDIRTIEGTNALNVTAFSKIAAWGFQYFQHQQYGHLVAISSIAGIRGGRVAPSYNASKAYQINFLEGLRQKAQKEKTPIVVTDIRPGFVKTDMAKGDRQFWVAEPAKAALQISMAIAQKKSVVYVTKRWSIIALLLKILPTWLYKRM